MDIYSIDMFRTPHYQNINAKRMEHLRSLGLPLSGKSILELGAGIGDITAFLAAMGCGLVTRIESRPENCAFMRQAQPKHSVICADLTDPKDVESCVADVSIAYGILYHLADPTKAIEFMARNTKEFSVVETCVSFGPESLLNTVPEDSRYFSQSPHGAGSRPTRPWMFEKLLGCFPNVYCPITQPDHPEFQLDWSKPSKEVVTRAIFVCSHEPMANPLLVDHLPDTHTVYTGS